VTVTFSADKIHWEIKPLGQVYRRSSKEEIPHLVGDVFKIDPDINFPACVLSWRRRPSDSSLVVHGSVFSLMEDLIISNIRFLDDLGVEIPRKKMEDTESPTKGIIQSTVESLLPTKAKERFVRQIIRKHLISQGMTVEGARVEISSAYT
jgi:hypothetical protein